MVTKKFPYCVKRKTGKLVGSLKAHVLSIHYIHNIHIKVKYILLKVLENLAQEHFGEICCC